MVLPCPGSSACSAPRPAAMRADDSNTQKLNLPCVETNSVKRLRGVLCAPAASGSAPTVDAAAPMLEGRAWLRLDKVSQLAASATGRWSFLCGADARGTKLGPRWVVRLEA